VDERATPVSDARGLVVYARAPVLSWATRGIERRGSVLSRTTGMSDRAKTVSDASRPVLSATAPVR
jgi:hypothetical protein